MNTLIFTIAVLAASISPMTAGVAVSDQLVWPPPPDQARLEYVGEIRCEDLKPGGGWFSKLGRLVGGSTEADKLTLPFDIVVSGPSLFMVCQNLRALVEVDRSSNNFKLHFDKKNPFAYPISLCDGGKGIIFVTDAESGTVFKFHKGKVRPFIVTGLNRPTGIAAVIDKQRLFIVDTGDHSIKIYDYDGQLLRTITHGVDPEDPLNYPTFATATASGEVLINDAMNYRIRRFDAEGNFIGEFGSEGDGPGTFARAKGMSVDSDGHVYVVDNLFDNFQIFDTSGQVLLAVGSGGQKAGQFWSPAGIDIVNDTIFIADTYNNRIQVLHYIGDSQ